MPSRTVPSTSCSGFIAFSTGIFKAGAVRSEPDGSLPALRQAFRPRTVSHHRLRVRIKVAAADADNAATEFIEFERNSTGMPGEMS